MIETPLAELRRQPFALLREMERRALATAGGQGVESAAREWVGIGFRVGEERFLVAREEIREIIACPQELARVPGARAWVAGLISVRGQLLTVVDLQHFLGGAVARAGRDSRILVINHRELGAGLLVDEVLGFRRLPEASRSAPPAEAGLHTGRFVAGAFTQPEGPWPVFSVTALVESPSFMRAAEDV